MKRRISVLVDAEIARRVKRRAAEERRATGALIEDALVQYLSKDKAMQKDRERAFRLFCQHPMRIPRGQLRYVLREDVDS